MNATNLMWSAKTKTKTNIRDDELLRDLLQWLALVKSLAEIENWAQWKLPETKSFARIERHDPVQAGSGNTFYTN